MSAIPWLIMGAVSPIVGYFNPIPQKEEGPQYTEAPRHHFRGTMENDSAFGEDNGYTHGTRWDYAYRMNNGDAWGVSLTQNIFTPNLSPPINTLTMQCKASIRMPAIWLWVQLTCGEVRILAIP